ncbi:MAG: hypothetical protein JW920_04710, partial [Deltaproteobacteria bacterium]|nr:hypothetical protein [Deltaproteobacteria bacterium]
MDAQEIFMEALKWIVLIFLAGFIGYFGRHLSKKIIERFRTGSVNVQQSRENPEPLDEKQKSVDALFSGKAADELLGERKKLEKNMVKLEKKARKAQQKRE